MMTVADGEEIRLSSFEYLKLDPVALGRSPYPEVSVDELSVRNSEPLSDMILALDEDPADVSPEKTEKAKAYITVENNSGARAEPRPDIKPVENIPEADTKPEPKPETEPDEITHENQPEAETKPGDNMADKNAADEETKTEENDDAQPEAILLNDKSEAKAVLLSDKTVAAVPYSEILAEMGYTPAEMLAISNFYDDTVFVGDSVLLGFRRYADRSSDPILKKMKFLTAGSFSLHNSFWDVGGKSVHPLYQGSQYQVWDSIKMMGAKRAFLFFGINDVSYGVEASVPLYPQLVAKIQEKSPGIDINIISATYTLYGKGKGKLNNQNIAAFNASVKQVAAQYGWGYIDMATVLSDGAGNLAPQYCCDGNLHESWAAYKVWMQELARYAAKRLGLAAR